MFPPIVWCDVELHFLHNHSFPDILGSWCRVYQSINLDKSAVQREEKCREIFKIFKWIVPMILYKILKIWFVFNFGPYSQDIHWHCFEVCFETFKLFCKIMQIIQNDFKTILRIVFENCFLLMSLNLWKWKKNMENERWFWERKQ